MQHANIGTSAISSEMIHGSEVAGGRISRFTNNVGAAGNKTATVIDINSEV